MRRIVVVMVLMVAGGLWTATQAVAGTATVQAPPEGLRADFNNDGADDLAVGAPGEGVGAMQLDLGVTRLGAGEFEVRHRSR